MHVKATGISQKCSGTALAIAFILAAFSCASCTTKETPKQAEPTKVETVKATDWTTLIKNEDAKAIETAIASGANPNELVYFPGAKGKISDFEPENVPPIWLAVFYHKPKILTLLLEKGAKPTAKASRVGDPAILLAAKLNQKDSVEILLDHGAEIDQANNGGFTALIGATIFRKLDMVNYLLQKNANPNILTIDGFTPLFLLLTTPSSDRSADQEIFKSFVKHGANIHQKIRKATLFELAISAENDDIAVALLQADNSFLVKSEKKPMIELVKKLGMPKLLKYIETH